MQKYIFLLLLLLPAFIQAQNNFFKQYSFTEADTLRGSLNPMRTCYDVSFYNMDLTIDISNQYISGFVDIHYQVVEPFEQLQVDLFKNMKIAKIEFEGQELSYSRIHNAVFIDFPPQTAGENGSFRIFYNGNPKAAMNAPWDGGFVWSKDKNGDPWVGVACEGIGASLWWPNKDHLSDEPDSMAINITVPKELTCVANGNLRKTIDEGGNKRFEWFVSYPINNYNVSVNIAKYAHFSEIYTAGDGEKLDLDYYVLSYNKEKAITHFQQVPKVLACFERFFGKYPFWEDGYALVETPYLGMEHQGAIAYGNEYKRGYLGRMIPQDMDWDYIIVHETGHEYFGNSVSCKDHAEMWIHESFTTYMESLFVECLYSYEDAIRYLAGQKPFIRNSLPIVGPMDVNFDAWGTSDHYFKGAWILHTLRHTINDDEKWWDLLLGFYKKYTISYATTEDFIAYVNTCTGKDYNAFFQQYLFEPSIPTLEYSVETKGKDLSVKYRLKASTTDLTMPILLGEKGKYIQVEASQKWNKVVVKNTKPSEFTIAEELMLVKSKKKS